MCWCDLFIILKQRIDTIKVETDVSVHNQEDVFGMETEFFLPQTGFFTTRE